MNQNWIDKIYRIGLVYLVVVTWRTLYLAQFKDYDLNYGDLIGAFSISLITFIVIVVLFFIKRKIVLNSKVITILYLLMNSPITILITIVYYQEIFNATLKH